MKTHRNMITISPPSWTSWVPGSGGFCLELCGLRQLHVLWRQRLRIDTQQSGGHRFRGSLRSARAAPGRSQGADRLYSSALRLSQNRHPTRLPSGARDRERKAPSYVSVAHAALVLTQPGYGVSCCWAKYWKDAGAAPCCCWNGEVATSSSFRDGSGSSAALP
jgi:hypothetical protein